MQLMTEYPDNCGKLLQKHFHSPETERNLVNLVAVGQKLKMNHGHQV